MKTVKLFFMLIFVMLVGCSSEQKKNNASINDSEFRNEKFIWWESSKGNGIWIEIDNEGDWKASSGVLTEFYNNGKVKLTESFLNGQETGLYRAWNNNGEMVISGILKNNRPDSIYRLYYPNGELRANYFLANCIPFQIEMFDRKGGKIAQFNLGRSDSGNFLKGSQFIYYPNGNPKVIIEGNKRKNYGIDNNIIEEFVIEDVSLHYAQVSLELLLHYMKKANFPKPMSSISGCISGDCQNGLGKFVDDIGATYTGNFVNGFLDGNGSICLLNGDTLYTGDFRSGMFHGEGVFYGQNEIYNGQFKFDLFNGYGEMAYSDGTKYIGHFLNDKRNGNGIDIDVDGTKFPGVWVNGEKVK
jgi:hypothetical protein